MTFNRISVLRRLEIYGIKSYKVKLFIEYIKLFNRISKYFKVQAFKINSADRFLILLKYNCKVFNQVSVLTTDDYIKKFHEDGINRNIWISDIKIENKDDRYWYVVFGKFGMDFDGFLSSELRNGNQEAYNKYLEDRQLVENLHKNFLKIFDLD